VLPIYILGAGPAGLAAAYTLTQQGQTVVIVERESQVGGLAKSIEYQGFILDLGPHRFYTKIPPVLKLWNEVLGTEQVTVSRLTRIYYNGKYFSYPLKALEVLFALGIVENVRIFFSYLAAKLLPNRHPENFSEWVTAKFGKRLFEIFFEAYTEKLWGIPCTEISAEWAAQRIKGLSLLKALRTAFFGSDGKVKSLIDQFQFPRLGSGQLYDKISDYLLGKNQEILLNTEVVRVHEHNSRVTQLTLRNRQTGVESTVRCSAVISSVPLNTLVEQMISPPPVSKSYHWRDRSSFATQFSFI
jgi:protoporphyrinogen oxidase